MQIAAHGRPRGVLAQQTLSRKYRLATMMRHSADTDRLVRNPGCSKPQVKPQCALLAQACGRASCDQPSGLTPSTTLCLPLRSAIPTSHLLRRRRRARHVHVCCQCASLRRHIDALHAPQLTVSRKTHSDARALFPAIRSHAQQLSAAQVVLRIAWALQ